MLCPFSDEETRERGEIPCARPPSLTVAFKGGPGPRYGQTTKPMLSQAMGPVHTIDDTLWLQVYVSTPH